VKIIVVAGVIVLTIIGIIMIVLKRKRTPRLFEDWSQEDIQRSVDKSIKDIFGPRP